MLNSDDSSSWIPTRESLTEGNAFQTIVVTIAVNISIGMTPSKNVTARGHDTVIERSGA
jgi:hypothetical protein